MNIDLSMYSDFVEERTSVQSQNLDAFVATINDLSKQYPNINFPLLNNSAIGMASEVGEFAELPKKIIFQGKPVTDDVVHHMKRELGDVIFYWVNACRAIGVNPNEVIQENIDKLTARYPGGVFNVHHSENRKEGDV